MSTKENYEKRMEEIIRKNTGKGKMRLLLHACCAPCSSAILESLAEFFSISVFFYNPNIDREEEFNRRAEECRRLVDEMPGVSTCIITNYIHDAFLLVAKGLEREPERGARCTACFKLRLEETAAFASRWNIEHPEEKYDYYCTSLSISPLKDADILNKLGEEMGEKYGIAFLPSDFKKKGRYQRSVELSKQHGLYRQDFCGCEFSRAESIRRKKEKEEAMLSAEGEK